MTKTLDYYNKHVSYYKETNHELKSAEVDRTHFLNILKTRSKPSVQPKILDAGCGTGRDTLAFLKEGLQVDAFDGSEEMVKLSSSLTGQSTKHQLFEDMSLPEKHYDGVWAQASLLHVKRECLPEVFAQLGNSLKEDGVLFASFKYGNQNRVDEKTGREFTDMTELSIKQMLRNMEGLSLVATSCRNPPNTQTNPSPWFSVVLQRKGPKPVVVLNRRGQASPLSSKVNMK